MNKSTSIKELATALNKAQAKMPRVSFNASNPFLKNKYADLGAIIEAARPVIAENGLAISQFPFSDGEMIGVTTILMHSSGEWLENSMTIHAGDEKGKSDAQVAGSIITYLRRYAYASVLGMYADEDTDGNKKQPAPDNGNGHREPETTNSNATSTETRPFSPAKMKETIATKVKSKGTVVANDRQVGLLAAMLEKCFAGEADADKVRYSVTKYLVGKESAKDMSGAEITSLLDWLKPEKDSGGDYSPSALAVKEAQAIRRQSLIDAGQMGLLETATQLGGQPN